MTLYRFLLITGILLSSLLVSAQPGNPPDPDDVVPISGIEILLGVGALFGSKRLYDLRKKS